MVLSKKIFWIIVLIPAFLFADILVDLELFHTQSHVFYIGDLNLSQLGSGPDIFRVTLQNTGPNDPERIRLRLEVRVNGRTIVTATSNNIDLPMGPQFVITQQQLNTGIFIAGQELKIKDYNLDLGDLENQIVATGKLPSGVYEFLLFADILDALGQPQQSVGDPDPQDNTLVITNPTTLELQFPGSPVSEPEISEVTSTFPYFQWQSDADLFNLYVFKQETGDRTPQDVLNHPPILHIERYPNKVFQYPSDTSPLIFPTGGGSVGPIRLLEPGGVYYWYVEAIIPTATGGEEKLKSEIYRFRIATPNETNAQTQQILNLLSQITDPDVQGMLQKLVAEGYNPNGNILVNGSPADMNALIQFLTELNQGKTQIQGSQIY